MHADILLPLPLLRALCRHAPELPVHAVGNDAGAERPRRKRGHDIIIRLTAAAFPRTSGAFPPQGFDDITLYSKQQPMVAEAGDTERVLIPPDGGSPEAEA